MNKIKKHKLDFTTSRVDYVCIEPELLETVVSITIKTNEHRLPNDVVEQIKKFVDSL